MQLHFASSERSTVGIEWELALIDRTTGDLVQTADSLLRALEPTKTEGYPRIVGEFLQNMVELASAPHHRVRDAVEDLRTVANRVRNVTEPYGIDLISTGTHPFARWEDQVVTDTVRYRRVITTAAWWGRQLVIWGIHVHVGVENRDKVLPLLRGLMTYHPHLQALSASSPFWQGFDTGYASNRAPIYQQLPTAGVPFLLPDWDGYEACIDDMMRVGSIADHTEIRWEVRPSPRAGTLESRICDGLCDLREIAAVAALTQCLVEHLSTALDVGQTLPELPPWYLRENRWRAARYGIEADVIVDSAGEVRPLTGEIRALVDILTPVAERLGCASELASVLTIVDRGPSYHRQRQVLAQGNGNLEVVVESLSAEFREGLDA